MRWNVFTRCFRNFVGSVSTQKVSSLELPLLISDILQPGTYILKARAGYACFVTIATRILNMDSFIIGSGNGLLWYLDNTSGNGCYGNRLKVAIGQPLSSATAMYT